VAKNTATTDLRDSVRSRKSVENEDFWNTRALFQRLHQFKEGRMFQEGEYTTGDVAEIFGISRTTVAHYCEIKVIPGAWRDEKRKWWHIPELSLGRVIERIQTGDREWTWRYFFREAAKRGSYE
jgi:helix-turn-helix protein